MSGGVHARPSLGSPSTWDIMHADRTAPSVETLATQPPARVGYGRTTGASRAYSHPTHPVELGLDLCWIGHPTGDHLEHARLGARDGIDAVASIVDDREIAGLNAELRRQSR